ncbi:MerR family transcriptional regulator [Solibacillus cecembensis]|uniref:MerR family transcriptional regulator n=1 Tax=Solibacillus cecembensis TaxID=459347 RepID=UPI003D00D31D
MKSIQQMSKQYRVTARTLRYYEELGILTPNRQGNTRLYSQREEAKMKLIVRGKKFGFTLDEIKEMVHLFNADRTGIKQLERTIQFGDEKIALIDEQIVELMKIRTELELMKYDFQIKLISLKGDSS